MNNFQVPYIPYPYMPPNPENIEQQIIKINKKIKELEQRINNLEKSNKDDYLKKDDGLYMI